MKEDIGMNIVKLIDMHSYRAVLVEDEKYGTCVLKVIRNRCRAKNGRVRPPIPSEVRIMKLLKKYKIRGVPEFYKWYYHDSFSTMLMPFYLAHQIESVWNDVGKIIVFMIQLLTVLRDLTAVDIMHRDVKLSNILWNDNDQRLLLIDFGLATINVKGAHYRGCGTKGYMAPEVYKLHDNVGVPGDSYNYRADIYSAGVVLGDLLYKTHENGTDRDTVKSWREVSRDLLKMNRCSKVLCGLHDLFLNMTKFKPDDRISYKNALRVLENLLNK